MKKICLSIVLCLLIFVSGCATVNVTKTARGYFPPTNANEIEILMTMPKRDFVEIAAVSTAKWPPGNLPKMHNSLRTKSAPLGADAVILSSSGMDPGGQYWSTGVAIRYKDRERE